MPTHYSDCSECHYHRAFDLDHFLNSSHNQNVTIHKCLKSKGLPDELCYIIIKKVNNPDKRCSYCENTKLCFNHAKRATENSIHYRKDANSMMCERCCWWEIS